MAKRLYSTKAIEAFLNSDIVLNEYNAIQIYEGSLGMGTWILQPVKYGRCPRWIVIKEVYINEWSIAHTVSQRLKLTKEDQKLWDDNVVTWTVKPSAV